MLYSLKFCKCNSPYVALVRVPREMEPVRCVCVSIHKEKQRDLCQLACVIVQNLQDTSATRRVKEQLHFESTGSVLAEVPLLQGMSVFSLRSSTD